MTYAEAAKIIKDMLMTTSILLLNRESDALDLAVSVLTAAHYDEQWRAAENCQEASSEPAARSTKEGE